MIRKPTSDLCRAPVLAALALLAGTAQAVDDGRWRFKLVPYAWFPGVTADLDTVFPGVIGPQREPRDVSVSAEVDPNNYLSNLDFAGMLIGEARKGPWLVYTDLIVTAFSSQNTQVHHRNGPRGELAADIARTATFDLSSTIWTQGFGYALVRDPHWSLELLAGFRFLDMSSHLTIYAQDERGRFLRGYRKSMDQQVWDGIVGVRGEVRIADTNWFIRWYGDLGGGDSNWTWQALLGLGYRFDWGEVTLAWRALSYHFDDNSLDLKLSGPGIGFGFSW